MGRLIVIVVLGALVAGCATTSHRQVETLKRPGGEAKVVLMPLDVQVYELTAAGIHEPKADWTDLARRHLSAAFDAEQANLGLDLAPFDESAFPPETIDRLNQLQRLHSAVGRAILLHQYVPEFALPSKKGKFDWTLGPSVRLMKNATGADYALFTYVNDGYSSGGRVALIFAAALFGVSVPGAVQTGFASLVDLETGDIVWFNRLLRGVGDVRTPEAARETAKVLLAGFPK